MNTEQAIKALKKLHRLCPANDDGDEMSEALVDAIVTLRAQQVRGKRCEAAEELAVSVDRDYTERDKMYMHLGRHKQDVGYNAYLIDAKQSGSKPLTLEQYLRGPQEGETDEQAD